MEDGEGDSARPSRERESTLFLQNSRTADINDTSGSPHQHNKPCILTWGLGKSGQLGTGQLKTEHIPRHIKLPSRNRRSSCHPIQIACGGLYTAAVSDTGDLYTTGCGKYGRLASGNDSDQPSFLLASLPEKVTQVSCGTWHGAAVTASGGLVVWGHPKACGNPPSQTPITTPSLLLLPSPVKVSAVACGHNFTLLCTQEGRVLSWGSGHHGVLGHGSTDDVASPRLVDHFISQETTITDVAAGYSHSAFVSADGEVYTCGKGSDGALGLGEKQLSDISRPKQVTFPHNGEVAKVSCSVGEHHGHTLALTRSGEVYSWGDGYKGKLGLGHQLSRYTPTLIPSIHFNNERVSTISAGGIHSAASTSEGSVFT